MIACRMCVLRKWTDFWNVDEVLSELRRAIPRHEHDVRG